MPLFFSQLVDVNLVSFPLLSDVEVLRVVVVVGLGLFTHEGCSVVEKVDIHVGT